MKKSGFNSTLKCLEIGLKLFSLLMSEENNEEITLQRDQTTQDFLTGLKEREELKSKLHEKERECNTLKGSIYDMTKKVEDLEKQVSNFDV